MTSFLMLSTDTENLADTCDTAGFDGSNLQPVGMIGLLLVNLFYSFSN